MALAPSGTMETIPQEEGIQVSTRTKRSICDMRKLKEIQTSVSTNMVPLTHHLHHLFIACDIYTAMIWLSSCDGDYRACQIGSVCNVVCSLAVERE